jgi:outer membrane immunogenic protein
MKKMWMASAALAAATVAGPALAGDIVVTPDLFTAPPAFAPQRFYNWTGAYVGPQGGGAFGRSDWTSVPDLTNGSYSVSGGLGGGTFGYNMQTDGAFVLGGEVDIAAASVSGTVPPATCFPNCQIKNHWLATARLRFGYAINDILPYATVGVGIGRLEAGIAGSGLGTEQFNNLSWAAGFGVEVAVAGPLTAKLEYLHVDLGGVTCNLACNGPVSMNFNENIVRAGVNYRIWQR